jgi:hypothetical protein
MARASAAPNVADLNPAALDPAALSRPLSRHQLHMKRPRIPRLPVRRLARLLSLQRLFSERIYLAPF